MKTLLSIGRSNRCDIVLNHTQISGEHASVRLLDAQKGLFEVEDLKSTNGVQKNGVRVQKAEFICEDRIDIAGVLLAPSLFLPYFYDMEGASKASADPKIGQKGAKGHLAKALQTPTDQKLHQKTYLIPHTIVPFFAGITLATALMGLLYLLSSGMTSTIPSEGGLSFHLLAATSGYALLFSVLIGITLAILESWHVYQQRKRQGMATLALWRSMVETAALRQTTNTLTERGWNGYRKFTVTRRHKETAKICSLLLKPHDGQQVPPCKAGQYIKLRIPNLGPGRALVRCYSLSDSVHTSGGYRILVKQIPVGQDEQGNPLGLSTQYLTRQVQTGSILDVAAPEGHFVLSVAHGAPVVLVGEDIEIAPLLSLLHALSEGEKHQQGWFFYGVRNQQEQLMPKGLQAIAYQAQSQNRQLTVTVCYSNPDSGSLLGKDYQYHGQPNIALLKSRLPSNNYHFFLSLPSAALVAMIQGLKDWGVPHSHIHYEVSSAATVQQLRALLTEPSQVQSSVYFARSDKRCTWHKGDGSLLDLARAHGIEIESDCRAGRCGSCLVAIRSGRVGYFTPPGNFPEEETCLSCIAYPKGNISVDA